MDRHLSPAETAKRFGISIKALRLYESRGLLNPARTASGSTGVAWRAYGPDQIARLHQILALKRLGLPLARIGEILSGADRLEPVLALQERVLVQNGERVARALALALVRAARGKLAAGQALSIDDLATLTKETTMTTKLSGEELFPSTLQPLKYFSHEELDRLAQREGYDHEKSIHEWSALHGELKTLAETDDPCSPAALDFCRRWRAQIEKFTHGDADLALRIRGMMTDAMADPRIAPTLPVTPKAGAFLHKAMQRFAESA